MPGECRVRAEHQRRHDPCLRNSRPAASTPPFGVILAMLGQALRVAPRGHGRGGIRPSTRFLALRGRDKTEPPLPGRSMRRTRSSAFVASHAPASVVNSSLQRTRRTGQFACCPNRTLPNVPGTVLTVIRVSDPSHASGRLAADRFASRPMRNAGVLCPTDLCAPGFLDAMPTKHGAEIPQDFSVIG